MLAFLAAQEPLPITLFRLRKAPRAPQEAPKRYSEASASKMRFGPNFGPTFGPPKRARTPDKSLESLQKLSKIKVLPFSDGIASRAGLGTLWGSILGLFWLPDGSNMASRAPKTAPGRPGETPRHFQERPRTSQDASRKAPSAPKTPPGLSKNLQNGSRGPQEASKRSTGEPLGPPKSLQELSRGAF